MCYGPGTFCYSSKDCRDKEDEEGEKACKKVNKSQKTFFQHIKLKVGQEDSVTKSDLKNRTEPKQEEQDGLL